MMAQNELKHILDMVNGWLRFAESKNGVLLALSVSAATAGRGIGEDTDCWFVDACRYGFVSLMFISAGICLASFLPQLLPDKLLKKGKREDADLNILYFGNIAQASAAAYGKEIQAVLNEGKELSKIERAYLEQIKVNSQIAFRKYRLFTWASLVGGLGLFLLLLIILATM